MYEFAAEIRGRHIEVCVIKGDDSVTFTGIVKQIYSEFFALIEDGTGRIVFINNAKVSYLCYEPEDEKLDEKKKKKLFG